MKNLVPAFMLAPAAISRAIAVVLSHAGKVNKSAQRRGSANMTGDSRAAVAYTLLLPFFLVSCTDFVTIPKPSHDQPPTITLSNFVVAGVGSVDQGQVTSNATVNVTGLRTRVIFSGGARNPVGGVKDFTIHVQNSDIDWIAHTTTTPDPLGRVPTNIAIPGTDGSGGVGSIPMEYTFRSDGDPVTQMTTVVGTATNYNGQTTTITELVQEGS